jgi:hypothetical protein
METLKYGDESLGTLDLRKTDLSTAPTVNYVPDFSSERAPHINRLKIIKERN